MVNTSVTQYDASCTESVYLSLENTSDALVPPKPKLFDTTTFSFLSCASRGTKLNLGPTEGETKFKVGGITFCSGLAIKSVREEHHEIRLTSQSAMTEKTASSAPAAPRRWPVAPFVPLTVT